MARLSSAIILYRRDIKFFESCVGKERVIFTHYGVDTEFFYPLAKGFVRADRILTVGHHLRNTQMLSRVVAQLAKDHPSLRFDIIVPEIARNAEGFRQLLGHPAVTWRKDLSDEDLRLLYQTSWFQLLPMSDSGACTAIVEALACGLPIVTTDVGGVRDYGGDEIYPVVADNDDNAMIALAEKYLGDPVFRGEVAVRCRNFAEQQLAWPIVAEKHLEAYRRLTGLSFG